MGSETAKKNIEFPYDSFLLQTWRQINLSEIHLKNL
jgi:hypothetical protein